jgi:hypothetical protein
VTTKGSFEDHLDKLEAVLIKLQGARLKVNANKSFFAREGLEYLGYWTSRDGIQPLTAKVEAIQRIALLDYGQPRCTSAWPLASQHNSTLGANPEAKNVFPTSATSNGKWELKRFELYIYNSNKLLESKDSPRDEQDQFSYK